MTLNWGMAIMDRLLGRVYIKPAPQPVVLPTVPVQAVQRAKPLDFDDFLRALGADL